MSNPVVPAPLVGVERAGETGAPSASRPSQLINGIVLQHQAKRWTRTA